MKVVLPHHCPHSRLLGGRHGGGGVKRVDIAMRVVEQVGLKRDVAVGAQAVDDAPWVLQQAVNVAYPLAAIAHVAQPRPDAGAVEVSWVQVPHQLLRVEARGVGTRVDGQCFADGRQLGHGLSILLGCQRCLSGVCIHKQ